MPTPQLVKIVTGGQTGADQGALLAARAAGVVTGGWAPQGWATEDGPAPWLADLGLIECPEPGYRARTWANARDSDATIWFGRVGTPGHKTTIEAARHFAKTTMLVTEGVTRPAHVVEWLTAHHYIKTLNVAGNRESLDPGVGDRVGAFLIRVFRLLERGPI
jgi:hypothetical protein